MVHWHNYWRLCQKFGKFSAIFAILPFSWHNQCKNHTLWLWHTFGVQNPTLNGTLLENSTLCGTEIGQNGTLAVLAYMCTAVNGSTPSPLTTIGGFVHRTTQGLRRIFCLPTPGIRICNRWLPDNSMYFSNVL